MSNQPDHPQPYPGTPPGYAPPDYVAPPAGQQPEPAQVHYGAGQYGAPQYAQYGAPHYGHPHYGAPIEYAGGPGYMESSGPRGLSLASMIVGLSSLFVVGWFIVPQVVGVVLGHIGLSKESPQGRPFSITGLITNYLALLVYLGIYAFFIYVAATFSETSTGTANAWATVVSKV
ncbi:hypothetical protein B5P43_16635 [Bacillus sp. SRB_336]|nr:hypothetical protein B5P43_16635 [Bacillus sp. SRB_336]